MSISKVTFFAASLLSLTSFAMEKADCDLIGGVPNPAATFCTENGGHLERVTTAAGEDALCVFECEEGRSVCGQWAYFHGECEPGVCAEWSTEADECAVWIAGAQVGDVNNDNSNASDSSEGDCPCTTTAQCADEESTHCGCNDGSGQDNCHQSTIENVCDCGSAAQDSVAIEPVVGSGGCEN